MVVFTVVDLNDLNLYDKRSNFIFLEFILAVYSLLYRPVYLYPMIQFITFDIDVAPRFFYLHWCYCIADHPILERGGGCGIE
jgi:hypothetical protein